MTDSKTESWVLHAEKLIEAELNAIFKERLEILKKSKWTETDEQDFYMGVSDDVVAVVDAARMRPSIEILKRLGEMVLIDTLGYKEGDVWEWASELIQELDGIIRKEGLGVQMQRRMLTKQYDT